MKKLLALFFSIYSINAFSQSGYVCIAELATGFAFNNSTKTWNTSNFNVKESKYLLSFKNGRWEWKKFGESYSTNCSKDFNEHGYLNCNDLEDISFNKRNLRYMRIYPIGYVSGGIVGKEGGDTPAMEIGKCSPM